MIVTALLMGVALKKDDRSISDAEIRTRALALGMVEGDSRTLADIQASQQSGQSPSNTSEPTETPEEAATSSPTPTVTPTETPEADLTATSTPAPEEELPPKPLAMVTPKPTVTNSPEPADVPLLPSETQAPASTQEPAESVTFVISSGQSSYGVSKSLAEVGLIEDALDFDRYLEDNGYSKRISTGTYEIPLGATEEEIAKIITRSR